VSQQHPNHKTCEECIQDMTVDRQIFWNLLSYETIFCVGVLFLTAAKGTTFAVFNHAGFIEL